jgi:putative FmdB family regulatory protein
VAFYEFRCDEHGAFDITRPLGSAPSAIACPECGGEATRVFSKPMLMSVPKDLVAALDHSEKTRHEPDIVTSLPPRDPRKRTPVLPLTPTLAKLPRPKY